MFYRAILPLLACGFVCGAESFESQPVGNVKTLQTESGTLTAESGHAAVIARHARTGKQALHILGGEKKTVRLNLSAPLSQDTLMAFWMQRWTKRAPFEFRVIAVSPA